MRVLSMLEIEHLLFTCFPHVQFFNLPRKAKQANVDQLRDGLAEIAATAREIQEAADREGRELTPTESRTIDTLLAQFQATEADIAAAEDDDSRRGTGRRTEPDAVGLRGRGGFQSGDSSLLRFANLPAGRQGRTWNDLFGASRGSSELPPGEFLRLLANNMHDPRLIYASQGEDTGSTGGFEVPTQLMRAIFDAGLDDDSLLARCSVYPLSSNSMTIPIANAFDRSSNVGGIVSEWVAESTAGTLQTGVLSQITLRVAKLMILVAMSNEVVSDSLSGGGIFADMMGAALKYDLNGVLINGTGAGQPQGILAAPSLITVEKESGQAADTLLFQNVVNMWARLHASCQRNAIWIASSSIIPQLLTMSFVPNVTAPVPVFSISGASSSPSMFLMGRPILVSEHSPQLGDLGDLVLVDPSKIAVGVRGGMALDRSVHARFTSDETTFRLVFRVDARPMWPSVVTPRSGAPTLSWAVTLEAR